VPAARVLCRTVDKHVARKRPPRDDGFQFELWDRRGRVCAPEIQWHWLWQLEGELLLMETDFHEGPQYALSPMEFIPVVAFLHGDVRCANIVFGKCLIDFDLGGRLEDTPTYPDGYVRSLEDGGRRGISGQGITKSDDWYALLNVIFGIHQLPVPQEVTMVELYRSRERFLGLIGSSSTDPDIVSLSDSTIQGLNNGLIKFLSHVGSWKVSFSDEFRDLVIQWGGIPVRTIPPRESSHPDTGSPLN
jgi:hypothetical protein